MRRYVILLSVVCFLFFAIVAAPSSGQVLYSQNFDVDDTANWTVNYSVTDINADFFYDYGTDAGIPSAPNSTGGTTRGMMLQANLLNGVFGGFSVSPTNQSFTGDYSLQFDLWSNYNGPLDGGGSGSTNLSTYGVLTSGTKANYPGVVDGVYFANTGDGGSVADWRAYSSDKVVSYQDGDPQYTDPTRNNTGATYQVFGGHTAPDAQLAMFSQQTGTTQLGSGGMTWHEVEIDVIGGVVTWEVDGVLLATVDTAGFITPTGGNNILFGHSDINATISTDPNAFFMLFTLVDNIVVEVAAAEEDNADFDSDNDVDGSDFLVWQKNFPISNGSAAQANGDATHDGNVNADDLAIWKTQFGTLAGVGAMHAIPEPASVLLFILGALGLIPVARCRR
ncbi:MAG: hypothetical protein JW829_10870 [Pirellulales bacterium]|nr:hypothetical protein [Pirellulales bacterium]